MTQLNLKREDTKDTSEDLIGNAGYLAAMNDSNQDNWQDRTAELECMVEELKQLWKDEMSRASRARYALEIASGFFGNSCVDDIRKMIHKALEETQPTDINKPIPVCQSCLAKGDNICMDVAHCGHTLLIKEFEDLTNKYDELVLRVKDLFEEYNKSYEAEDCEESDIEKERRAAICGAMERLRGCNGPWMLQPSDINDCDKENI